jgi:hypothetical protein
MGQRHRKQALPCVVDTIPRLEALPVREGKLKAHVDQTCAKIA